MPTKAAVSPNRIGESKQRLKAASISRTSSKRVYFLPKLKIFTSILLNYATFNKKHRSSWLIAAVPLRVVVVTLPPLQTWMRCQIYLLSGSHLVKGPLYNHLAVPAPTHQALLLLHDLIGMVAQTPQILLHVSPIFLFLRVQREEAVA
jgi:hypothetical protein